MSIDLNTEFPQDEQLIYLNHAAVAPWPKRTADAVAEFARENITLGAQHYPRWLQKEQQLREQFAQLINAASTDDIALQKNTSEGLSAIAYGLDWQQGDNVVISNHEFPSNRIVWESLAPLGVTVRQADFNTNDPVNSVINFCDQNTKLVSVSSIQYASGVRIDLAPIGAFCQDKDILFCVDAIQSLGVFPFDCQEINADFVVADGHKWMLGPEGLALFYSRETAREQLKLNQFGWHMVEAMGDYDRVEWDEATSARKFECGSPNMLGTYALSASLSLILEYGVEQIAEAVLDKTAYLSERLEKISGVSILSPQTNGNRSGIVTFKHECTDSAKLHKTLMGRKIICAHRGGGVRFSPHFYTPKEKLDRAISAVAELVTSDT